MTLERITWQDHHSVDNWCEIRDLGMSPKTVVTIGLVVKENDSAVAVSTCYSNDNDVVEVSCTMVIQTKLIVSRELLADARAVEAWVDV